MLLVRLWRIRFHVPCSSHVSWWHHFSQPYILYTHAYEDSIRIIFVYRKLPLQFEGKIRAVNAFSLVMCEFLIILYISSVKTHVAAVNHHAYIAVCPVTLLLLKSGYHGFRSENIYRPFPDCKQVLYLSYDCEGFLAAMHDTTFLVSYIYVAFLPFMIIRSFLNSGWIFQRSFQEYLLSVLSSMTLSLFQKQEPISATPLLHISS